MTQPSDRSKESFVYLTDPHSFLGLQSLDDEHQMIRLFRPGWEVVEIELKGENVVLDRGGGEGIFEKVVSEDIGPLDYKVIHQSGLKSYDPYAFPSSVGEMDLFLFGKGVHYEVYEMMGARLTEQAGVQGVRFVLWAPHAMSVHLICDTNHWNAQVNPMRKIGEVWELFIPGLQQGEKYKFIIHDQEGRAHVKIDPYATFSEIRPKNASSVFDPDTYEWNDEAWMSARGEKNALNIYEIHLGSWKRTEKGFCNYREIAHELAEYCVEMGFSHVELMPLCEHPLDESWGYQVTGFYAVTSRFGTPADFQYFVDHLHQKGIGVILDWVPAHFPTDEFALARFDGSYLYEHADPRKGFHPHWNTHIFNYGRNQVSNFLIGSALYWLEKMHVDGLRVDAVASMLHLDYGRKKGEWVPNIYGGNENLEAIDFLKHLNAIVHERYPGILMIAEESSTFSGVSHPVEAGGLGFDLKWNMGWMNDTLRYIQREPIYRHHHQNELTFSMMYAYSERFALVLSHDEVVHEKKSLISKMPGDEWQQFAGMRLLYSYMICHPGKNHLFMGGEFGMWSEWNSQEQIPWRLLEKKEHKALQQMVKELNHFYHKQPALWEYDFEQKGFEWIDCNDRENSVISYLRKSDQSYLACVHNFTPCYHPNYTIPLRGTQSVKEIFNTDREEYGGSGKINSEIHIANEGFTCAISPLATMIFEVRF